MNSITNIIYLNVNWLRGARHRWNIFEWLRGLEVDLFLLQDVWCEGEEDRINWTREWGGVVE